MLQLSELPRGAVFAGGGVFSGVGEFEVADSAEPAVAWRSGQVGTPVA